MGLKNERLLAVFIVIMGALAALLILLARTLGVGLDDEKLETCYESDHVRVQASDCSVVNIRSDTDMEGLT